MLLKTFAGDWQRCWKSVASSGFGRIFESSLSENERQKHVSQLTPKYLEKRRSGSVKVKIHKEVIHVAF